MKAYRGVLGKAFNKQIDFDSDALVWTLHTSTYTPNYDTHAFVSDLTNELTTGGGYTAGTAGGGASAPSTRLTRWSSTPASPTPTATRSRTRRRE